jgi:hypothetical protein
LKMGKHSNTFPSTSFCIWKEINIIQRRQISNTENCKFKTLTFQIVTSTATNTTCSPSMSENKYFINTQNHWVSGLCPQFGIPKSRKHTITEPKAVTIFRWREGNTYCYSRARHTWRLTNAARSSIKSCRLLFLTVPPVCSHIFYSKPPV